MQHKKKTYRIVVSFSCVSKKYRIIFNMQASSTLASTPSSSALAPMHKNEQSQTAQEIYTERYNNAVVTLGEYESYDHVFQKLLQSAGIPRHFLKSNTNKKKFMAIILASVGYHSSEDIKKLFEGYGTLAERLKPIADTSKKDDKEKDKDGVIISSVRDKFTLNGIKAIEGFTDKQVEHLWHCLTSLKLCLTTAKIPRYHSPTCQPANRSKENISNMLAQLDNPKYVEPGVDISEKSEHYFLTHIREDTPKQEANKKNSPEKDTALTLLFSAQIPEYQKVESLQWFNKVIADVITIKDKGNDEKVDANKLLDAMMITVLDEGEDDLSKQTLILRLFAQMTKNDELKNICKDLDVLARCCDEKTKNINTTLYNKMIEPSNQEWKKLMGPYNFDPIAALIATNKKYKGHSWPYTIEKNATSLGRLA